MILIVKVYKDHQTLYHLHYFTLYTMSQESIKVNDNEEMKGGGIKRKRSDFDTEIIERRQLKKQKQEKLVNEAIIDLQESFGYIGYMDSKIQKNVMLVAANSIYHIYLRNPDIMETLSEEQIGSICAIFQNLKRHKRCKPIIGKKGYLQKHQKKGWLLRNCRLSWPFKLF